MIQCCLQNKKYTIQVINSNDNNPIFANTNTLRVAVHEDVRFAVLGNASATDGDAGIFGKLTYEIASAVGPVPFKVDPLGMLYLEGVLDRESKSRYSFFVKVSDGGTPSRIALRAVEVIVADINDNAPMFHQNYSISISEASISGCTNHNSCCERC